MGLLLLIVACIVPVADAGLALMDEVAAGKFPGLKDAGELFMESGGWGPSRHLSMIARLWTDSSRNMKEWYGGGVCGVGHFGGGWGTERLFAGSLEASKNLRWS